jgi:hypothetical protein
MRYKLIETVAPPGDEVGIVEVLIDYDMQHCQRQGTIAAGPDRNPEICLGRIRLHLRLDHYELGTPLLGI